MACSNLTSGLFLDCIDGTGGIEKVFIANGKVVSFAHTNGLVTAITTGAGALDPSDFFEFEIPKQTGSLSETINVSQENGTLFYDQALSLVFNRLDLEKRNQIALIAKSNDMVVVAKDNNGNYWSVGLEKGAYMSAGSSVSGTAYGDRTGYEITLSGMESKPMFKVTASIVE